MCDGDGHETEAGARPPLQDLEFECRSDEDSVIVFAPPREDASEPAPSIEEPENGFGYFELPYRNYVFLAADGTRAIYNWIPLSQGSCRLEFMGYANSGAESGGEVEGRHVVFLDDELPLLAQDRILLESAQPWLEQGRGDDGAGKYERSVPSDVAPLMARNLVTSTLRCNGKNEK